jgi:hypothetical protein
MTDSLLIVGRGPSARGFEGWDDYGDIMALSSGIYAVPKDARPPKHFATLDNPKWYLCGLWDRTEDYFWQNDPQCQHWPFWATEKVQKHVPLGRARIGQNATPPKQVWDAIPDFAKLSFAREMVENWNMFGFQPGWGDYPNIRQWLMNTEREPSFNGGAICMACPKGMGVGYQGDEAREAAIRALEEADGMGEGSHAGQRWIRSSFFYAVQVAERLGYRKIHFIGCDFNHEYYGEIRDWAGWLCGLALRAGLELVCLTPDSVLANYIPVEVHA